MRLQTTIEDSTYIADLTILHDLTLSTGPTGNNPNAFGIPAAEFAPIKIGNFTGSVLAGSGANCDVLQLCAHGNGTHTECIGHITPEHEFVPTQINNSFLTAQLITISLGKDQNNQPVIDKNSFNPIQTWYKTDAILIRTLPNSIEKKSKNWSGSNPPYFDSSAMEMLVNKNYQHLLVDLPSVDPEHDEGKLSAHHIWWQTGTKPRQNASITELIYIDNIVSDGLYFLNLQIPALHTDAVPSRILISPLVLI